MVPDGDSRLNLNKSFILAVAIVYFFVFHSLGLVVGWPLLRIVSYDDNINFAFYFGVFPLCVCVCIALLALLKFSFFLFLYLFGVVFYVLTLCACASYRIRSTCIKPALFSHFSFFLLHFFFG